MSPNTILSLFAQRRNNPILLNFYNILTLLTGFSQNHHLFDFFLNQEKIGSPVHESRDLLFHFSGWCYLGWFQIYVYLWRYVIINWCKDVREINENLNRIPFASTSYSTRIGIAHVSIVAVIHAAFSKVIARSVIHAAVHVRRVNLLDVRVRVKLWGGCGDLLVLGDGLLVCRWGRAHAGSEYRAKRHLQITFPNRA